MDYIGFFKAATHLEPYHYQLQLGQSPWPQTVHVPTGMGKTAAVMIAWLFKRKKNDPSTPRRLVYCLPMRVLVEQTVRNASQWIGNLVHAGMVSKDEAPHVHTLMGGEIDNDWDLSPERDTILVGTQDQLLSRALNRGYGMGRFRWPLHFGLLNNDSLWIFDEIQLMDSGLTTSLQLQAMRDIFGTSVPTKSLWMSATLNRNWLNTVDFDADTGIAEELCLAQEDQSSASLKRRFEARKPIQKASCAPTDAKAMGQLILDTHQEGTKTLVVLNTVKKAMDIYDALKKANSSADLCLVHSRFRPPDRLKSIQKLLDPPSPQGVICISTQVVEAGVDVSAATLITELAPWPSLVQRFGRCNRFGDENTPGVYWVHGDLEKKGMELPYSKEDLEHARELLSVLEDAAPRSLPPTSQEVSHRHVLRRKDLRDLFDTTADLTGADIDISRFIRESEDLDVQVFWRDLPGQGPEPWEPLPAREELCMVPVAEIKKLKEEKIWRWDHLDKRWVQAQTVYPGQVLMLGRSQGFYSDETGWTGSKKDIPSPMEKGRHVGEANDDDFLAQGTWQTLADHNDLVIEELERILRAYPHLEGSLVEDLKAAARWHDLGKAHEVFRNIIPESELDAPPGVIWAKFAGKMIPFERKGFRHELPSALAMLMLGQSDLAAYLAAAHHGKVRLSIKSLPTESRPPHAGTRFARGTWDGDLLPGADMGGGHTAPQLCLDLSYMEMGESHLGESWVSRMIRLRDRHDMGPFRLAFLESLLRAADRIASKKAMENVEQA